MSIILDRFVHFSIVIQQKRNNNLHCFIAHPAISLPPCRQSKGNRALARLRPTFIWNQVERHALAAGCCNKNLNSWLTQPQPSGVCGRNGVTCTVSDHTLAQPLLASARPDSIQNSSSECSHDLNQRVGYREFCFCRYGEDLVYGICLLTGVQMECLRRKCWRK